MVWKYEFVMRITSILYSAVRNKKWEENYEKMSDGRFKIDYKCINIRPAINIDSKIYINVHEIRKGSIWKTMAQFVLSNF